MTLTITTNSPGAAYESIPTYNNPVDAFCNILEEGVVAAWHGDYTTRREVGEILKDKNFWIMLGILILSAGGAALSVLFYWGSAVKAANLIFGQQIFALLPGNEIAEVITTIMRFVMPFSGVVLNGPLALQCFLQLIYGLIEPKSVAKKYLEAPNDPLVGWARFRYWIARGMYLGLGVGASIPSLFIGEPDLGWGLAAAVAGSNVPINTAGATGLSCLDCVTEGCRTNVLEQAQIIFSTRLALQIRAFIQGPTAQLKERLEKLIFPERGAVTPKTAAAFLLQLLTLAERPESQRTPVAEVAESTVVPDAEPPLNTGEFLRMIREERPEHVGRQLFRHLCIGFSTGAQIGYVMGALNGIRREISHPIAGWAVGVLAALFTAPALFGLGAQSGRAAGNMFRSEQTLASHYHPGVRAFINVLVSIIALFSGGTAARESFNNTVSASFPDLLNWIFSLGSEVLGGFGAPMVNRHFTLKLIDELFVYLGKQFADPPTRKLFHVVAALQNLVRLFQEMHNDKFCTLLSNLSQQNTELQVQSVALFETHMPRHTLVSLKATLFGGRLWSEIKTVSVSQEEKSVLDPVWCELFTSTHRAVRIRYGLPLEGAPKPIPPLPGASV